MKIQIGCSNDRSYKAQVEVYLLDFDVASRTFSMPRPVGDDWLQKITCRLTALPSTLNFGIGGAVHLEFELRDDAEVFVAWLESAEREAQRGYATMRG